jgi:protein-S-isoprenylcysteine O-methyltransferase Ste14
MGPDVKIILFATIGVVLALLSRRTLNSPAQHGFHRFLAWLAILALLLGNIEHWFVDKYSPRQLLSWLLLGISIYLVTHGAVLLGRHGHVDPTRPGGALFRFEKTTRLVRVSVYRFIRHPLYGSLIFLAWGIFLKNPNVPGASLALVATLFMVFTARVEESECIRYFGRSYREYMDRTRMFIPYLV